MIKYSSYALSALLCGQGFFVLRTTCRVGCRVLCFSAVYLPGLVRRRSKVGILQKTTLGFAFTGRRPSDPLRWFYVFSSAYGSPVDAASSHRPPLGMLRFIVECANDRSQRYGPPRRAPRAAVPLAGHRSAKGLQSSPLAARRAPHQTQSGRAIRIPAHFSTVQDFVVYYLHKTQNPQKGNIG